ncbi:MAG: nucleoside deaminase [Oscillospiraceae bacterium]|nr:nucleoside deaminase [Oscillospiraceae bacterium]
MHNQFIKTAIDEAMNGMAQGHGGPFGAVIVQNNEIIAANHNRVLSTNDPTMHAEIAAIRQACAKLNRFSLHDCEIYSTCMPCPMCLGAIMWAKIQKLYYGARDTDAAKAGFDDKYIYDYIKNNNIGENLKIEIISEEECKGLFRVWENIEGKTMY